MIRATLGPSSGWPIDELARRTGVTARTIRAHQTAGLLPPPRVRGRTAYYGEEHARRLTAITRLQARGWSRAAIREALEAWDGGRGLGDLLGLRGTGASATTPGDWADELFAGYVAPAAPRSLLPPPLSN
ncbi:MAG: MerR family transcriptional regulator [Actinomycetota bacterium]